MEARGYTLSNYLYFLLKIWVGMLPIFLALGRLMDVSLLACLAAPLFVCAVKVIITAVTLAGSRNGQKIRSENLPDAAIWVGAGLSLAAAYLPPLMGVTLPQTVFLAAAALMIAAGVFCFAYVWRYPHYLAVYRTLLASDSFLLAPVAKQKAADMYRKKIETDLSATSRQIGYRYFNDLFMKRHAKILTKAAKRITVILAGLVLAAAAACLWDPEIKVQTNQAILSFLPYTLLLMYFINRGRSITAAMFMNCDHSMLTYRFYRRPKAVLSLFAERLKYVALINLIPAAVLALGLPLLLLISGGTDQPVHYAVLVVSVLAMSVFFSVHTLILYYLLQPYNKELETKNFLYTLADVVTYYICFFAAGKSVSILVFGIGITAFCIVYVAVALFLVYRFAPKTFKLRI